MQTVRGEAGVEATARRSDQGADLRVTTKSRPLLIQRVDYDGDKGTVSVTFQPAGIEKLSREYAEENA